MLRWQKKGDNILLRVVSHEIVAADSLPIHEAVVNSNFEPILYSFPIKAFHKDSVNNASVIEVTDLFEKDICDYLNNIGYLSKKEFSDSRNILFFKK